MSKGVTLFVILSILLFLVITVLTFREHMRVICRIEQRFELSITGDAILQAKQRMWLLEDRHKAQGEDDKYWNDYEDAVEYRDLKKLVQRLKIKELKLMEIG